MSSTTESSLKRGQVLVIFGLSLVTIIVVAALAFDTGMMLLERRQEQTAADAAALAGARYLVDSPAQDPKVAARAIGTANGYTDGVDNETVVVNIPPTSGHFQGLPGFIEVVIHDNRPSIFGGIIGALGWNVSARAVAANQPGLDLPFSMLTLDPTSCKSLQVTGNGTVESGGTIQVNSECAANALFVGGTGILTVTAEGATCNVVGGMDEQGGGTLDCTQVPDSYAIEDPLRTLPLPAVPSPPAAPQELAGTKGIPSGCTGASAANPATCQFNGSYKDTTWRLYPGYYPGGLELQRGTFYLEPGVYYIGGGGFRAGGGSGPGTLSVISVDAGTATYGGGVLLYNTEDYLFHDACADGTATSPLVQCIDPIILNGGSAPVDLKPLDDGSDWDGLVIFQDRNLNYAGDDVQINGGNSDMEVAGTIYVPSGDVKVNGNAGTLTLDQVIAWTFKINGNGGEIDVLYRSGVTAHVSGAGLVE